MQWNPNCGQELEATQLSGGPLQVIMVHFLALFNTSSMHTLVVPELTFIYTFYKIAGRAALYLSLNIGVGRY